MKATAIPKPIHELSAAIQGKHDAIKRCRADIERAGAAAREAEHLEGELAALSDKRARVKAEAFIAGTKADIAELDRQEAELEKASRKAREDGKAGALAIEMLEERIAGLESEIAGLSEQRKAAVLDWLDQRTEAALDSFMGKLEALGPVLAEAIAVDTARNQLRGNFHPGLAGLFRGKWELPVPYSRQEPVPGRPDVRRISIEWYLSKSELGQAEFVQLSGELEAVGVIE